MTSVGSTCDSGEPTFMMPYVHGKFCVFIMLYCDSSPLGHAIFCLTNNGLLDFMVPSVTWFDSASALLTNGDVFRSMRREVA